MWTLNEVEPPLAKAELSTYDEMWTLNEVEPKAKTEFSDDLMKHSLTGWKEKLWENIRKLLHSASVPCLHLE